jgi:hypothetical protein
MGKLDATAQKKLDDWAAAAVAGAPVDKAEIAANGAVTKPSATQAMMEALQGALTESVLDEAMKKADPKYGMEIAKEEAPIAGIEKEG